MTRARLRRIDASLNRATEGLRVAEDTCRFEWDLAGLAAELRELRHHLLAIGRGSSAERADQIAARDIEGDVGRDFGAPTSPPGRASEPAPSEMPPESGEDTVLRNLQRTREALRSLEEAWRGQDPERRAEVEGLRYRLYSVEKGVVHARCPSGRAGRLAAARLCLLLTEALCRLPWRDVAREALEGGVDILQLREKALPDRELLARARWLRELTARRGALLIVNDRPDIALASRADGVHVGQEDLPCGAVREIVGERMLIGISTHSREQARRAAREGADMVGVGPVYPTATKDAGPALGASGLRDIVADLEIPGFAIGGIRADRIAEVLAAGADRVALSSALLGAEAPGEAARGLAELLRPAGG